MGILENARLRLYVKKLPDGAGDTANSRTLKPLLRESILRDAVPAF